MWHDGRSPRSATLLVDTEMMFVPAVDQRRKRCGVCSARWVHRPDGISSRAHYQPCVVSHALSELGTDPAATTITVAETIACAPSTVRRWGARVAELADPAAIASAMVREADEPVLPQLPIEIASPQRSPRLRALLLRAIQVLVLLEALASLRGIAPPALAHAAILIPANASGPGFQGDPPLPA